MRNRTIKHCTTATILIAALLAFAPGASAFKVISEAGEGAGQTQEPSGIASDFETGRLYVADKANNRVDVFDASGTFERAFGWGVKNGHSEFQVCTSVTTCRKGLAGAGNGQFSKPHTIAVDNHSDSPSFHDVYVFDSDNMRIEKFDQEGNFILSFGSIGEGEGKFSSFNTLVGVAPGGTVYVVDSSGSNDDVKIRLQRFEPSGVAIAPQRTLQPEKTGFALESLAVDSTGDLYVADGKIRKYEPTSGLPIDEIERSVGGLQELAVDAADSLFVSTVGESGVGVTSRIAEYDPTGNPLRTFGYGSFLYSVNGIAPYHSASGEIYASEEYQGNRVIHLDFPLPGPLVLPEPCQADPTGNTKATLKAHVNPEGKATTFHFQYVDQESFASEGGFSSPNTKTTPESESVGSDFDLHEASSEASIVPETEYHCRVVVTNADATITGEEGTFTSLPPLQIGATWSSNVGTEAATLNATVNPLGIPTTGFFEYVDDATYQKDIAESGAEHGFDHAVKAPAGDEIDFGAGESLKAASAVIDGLSPAATYHYRVVAADPYFPGGFSGPASTVRTYRAGEGSLLDDRAWELVSPGLKNGAEVAVPWVAGGLWDQEGSVRIQAASGSGEAITYTSWTAFGEAKGAPSASQYLSKRSASGWGTENITPFGILFDPLQVPYRGFTADLGFGAFGINEPSLTGDAPEGFENLYLRDNETGAIQALTIEAPQLSGSAAFCTGYAGASADGKHAIFAAKGAMAGAPVGKGFSLYEWSAGGGLSLVSVLPDGSPAPPIEGSGYSGEGTGFGAVGGNCLAGQAIVHNAISVDGSVIFWTYGGKYKGSEHPLLARIDGTETIQLDAKPSTGGGSGPFGGGIFRAAAGDGSKAFFTAPGKLTSTSGATGQLYRYDTTARALIDVTPGAAAPEIEGVIGASEDGAYVYFVARGVLSGEEENAAHQKAVKGAANLYLWHEGEGVRFILSGLNGSDWISTPERQTARVTPDGRHLAFLSAETEALSAYNNAIFPGVGCQPGLESRLIGDPHCAEVYLYDADAKTFTCASCNPSGARPTGPTQLPTWSNPYEGPRYLSDDGSRLYFESRDVLSGADENQNRDVYEYERVGKGTCTSESATFVPSSSGCLSLISSGKSDDESYLLDASSGGRDIFFSTRHSLVGWDVNDNYDVYDAREGGGLPEPTEQPICQAEACKPPPTTVPPSEPSPSTATFQGPANVVETPKKKHRHRAKKHKSRHRGAHGKGRTAR